MEAKRIKVIKDQLKPKLVYNIQVFLNYANFYWQFIQSFNRIVILLISILKMIESLNKQVFSRNNNNKLVFEKNNNNNKINRFGISRKQYGAY